MKNTDYIEMAINEYKKHEAIFDEYIQSGGNYEEALKTGVAAGSASAFSRLLATKEEIIQIKQNI